MRKKNSMTIVSQWFWSLILAQIIANITPFLANISNGLLVGNSLTPTAMAALSFVAPISGLLAALAAVISLGSNIMCGNSMGRGESDEINRIFTTAILTITALGVVLTIVTESFPGYMAFLLGAEGEALPDTIAYLKGLFTGILPSLLVPCLVVFLNMANEITYAMMSTIVLAAVNLILGLINLKLLDGGMFGMGLSSALSQYAALAFLLIRFLRKKSLARVTPGGFRFSYIWKIVLLGSPSALMFFLYSIRNIQINSLSFENGGTAAVTALGILSSSAGLFDAVNTGIGSTVVMMASVMVGEEDRESLKKLTKYCFTVGAVLVFVKTGIFAALAHPIARIFGAGEAEFGLVVSCVYLYAACMPFNLVQTVIVKIYQCLNRVFLSNVIYVLTCIVFPIGLMIILSPIYGIYGVWSNYALAEVLTIAVLFGVSFAASHRFPSKLEDWLWLDKSFASKKENQLTCIAESDALVQQCAVQIGVFLNELDCGREIAKECVKEIEKLGRFIMERNQGISGKKKRVIEILTTVKDHEMVIRLRDNFREYDLSNELIVKQLMHAGHTEVKYQSTFGMNIVTLKKTF